jgi:hypothetical protein
MARKAPASGRGAEMIMRARQMLRRLDRIAPDEKERLRPVLSVLSPWEYDRFKDLAKNFNSLSLEEQQELLALLEKCPVQNEDDKHRVPIEVSRPLSDIECCATDRFYRGWGGLNNQRCA